MTEKIAQRVLTKIALDERGAGRKLFDAVSRPSMTEVSHHSGGLFEPSTTVIQKKSLLEKLLENPSETIEKVVELAKRHPYITAGLAAGALGYGYGHNMAQNRAIRDAQGSKIDKAYDTVAKMDTVGGDPGTVNKLTSMMDAAAAKIKRFSGLGGLVR